MQLVNTKMNYGLVAVLLHWLSALSVIGLFALGWWMVRLGYYDAWYTQGPYWHKGVGVLFGFLLLLRLVWKLLNPKTEGLHQSAYVNRLINAVHWMLYALLFAIVITGYLITTADGRDLGVFNWFSLPASITSFDNQETLMGNWHRWAAYVLAGLVVMHILAALKHHFIDQDATLKRMLGKS